MPRNPEGNSAELSRVFPGHPGSQVAPDDRRLREIRHLKLPCTLPDYRSLAEWQRRASELRQHILVSTGLWPLPARAPLSPVIFGRIEREDYSVEKVYFESYPGHFVTGNLYRPLRQSEACPGVLTPHGHWKRGRLHHDEMASAAARGISFARQGYVAFTYDMVGYADSTAIPHTFGGPRETLWGISLMGLQLWNSIRCVDFLESLPDVDATRIGCTGESGGGTQTFMLTAVDDRIKVAAPVNMVSAHFQGGCLCENAPSLRLDTNNVEIAALAAPRPMLLVSCTGDWTCNNPSVEYPAIRDIYGLYGAADRVDCVQIMANHNYNLASREAVYAFFAKWLRGSVAATDTREKPLVVEDEVNLRVFATKDHDVSPLSAAGLTDELVKQAEQQFASAWPQTAADLEDFRKTFGPAMQCTLATEWPSEVAALSMGSVERKGFTVDRLLLGRPDQGDQVPAVLFRPDGWERGDAALVVHEEGKAGLIDAADGQPITLVRELIQSGRAVLAVDPFLTGEYLAAPGTGERDPSVQYFTTYNRTVTALRVQDILTALAFLRQQSKATGVDLIGIGDAGLWCLLARAIAPAPTRVVADVAGFVVADDASYSNRLDIPGLRRAGDFRAALALAAPAPTLIHNAQGNFSVAGVHVLYQTLACPQDFRIENDEVDAREIVGWLAQG